MAFGGSGGNLPGRGYGMLASAADREAAQATLKQAFEDERLTQDEFEDRVGRAVAARTQAELAELTRDIPGPAPAFVPVPAGPRRGRVLVPAIAAAVIVLALAVLLVAHVSSSGTAGHSSAAARPVRKAVPGPAGPAKCPVGTSQLAVTIANDLARDPVYVDQSSGLLSPAQASRLQAEIGRLDAGRIRIAAVTPATVRRGGGERALANAIASCAATGAGTTMLTTRDDTYVVTSYSDNNAATRAVGAALNTHASLGPGLTDAVRRVAEVDKRAG
jgi:Domain of unknown function (DUF1707)